MTTARVIGTALIAAVLAGGACGLGDDDQAADPAVVDALTDVRWLIAGYLDGDEVLDVEPAGRDAFIVFEPDGRVTGNDGCNGFFVSSYDVRTERIRYGGESGQELELCDLPDAHTERFGSVVRGSVDYELEGDRLTLLSGGGRGVLFTAER